MTGTRVEAWRVHDTGLVAVPTRFRRLGGLVRHLQGHGDRWPAHVVLEIDGGHLRIDAASGPIGSWPVEAVTAARQSSGPPVHFVLDTPAGTHLLAAAAGPDVDALLDVLTR